MSSATQAVSRDIGMAKFEDCTGSDRETMCEGLQDGTSYKRSIEEHENHTFDSAY